MAPVIIRYIQKYSWIFIALILVFGWTAPWLMVVTFICMVAPIIFSFGNGRAWCGNFCPRNSFSSEILSKLSPQKSIPRFCKNIIFRSIIFLLLMSLFSANLYYSNGSLLGIGYAFLRMMLLTTIIQITLGILIHANIWCSFCPMGSVASLITKLRLEDTNFINIGSSCDECGKCKSVCPTQLDISKWKLEGVVRDANCMYCKSCVRNCPKKALS